MAQPVFEGTWEELLQHDQEFAGRRLRLTIVEDEDQKPTPPPIDAEAAAAIALLESWMREDAAQSPEERQRANEEYEELKRNLNANRAETGELVTSGLTWNRDRN